MNENPSPSMQEAILHSLISLLSQLCQLLKGQRKIKERKRKKKLKQHARSGSSRLQKGSFLNLWKGYIFTASTMQFPLPRDLGVTKC